ncbi:MAG: hypothetical protein ACI84O_001070 [Myxococcota bacterium]|jgi:hypothetical protein
MLKQSLYRKLLTSVLLILVGWACAPSPIASSSLDFEDMNQDLGSRWAGENITLYFPFTNNSAETQQITRIQTSCGCLNPRVLVSQQAQTFPVTVASGASGVVEIDFNTGGFKNVKKTGAQVYLQGQALPVDLAVEVFLNNWFKQQPEYLKFATTDGSREQSITIEYVGQKPFRFTEVLSVSPPLRIEGVPSAELSLSQTVELVLPPTTNQGTSTASFNLQTNHEGFRVVGITRYEVEPPVWVSPNGKLLLGAIPAGVMSYAAVDVGANVGKIELQSTEVGGIEGVKVRVQSLKEGKHLRLQLEITPPTTAGAFSGELNIDLIHDFDGKKTPVSRKILIFGVTQAT